MYIEKLTIKNFRCFAQEKIKFNGPGHAENAGVQPLRMPNMNLIIGSNGIGKTTLFQALTLATLGPYLARSSSGLQTPIVIRHQTKTAEAHANLFLSAFDTDPNDTNKLQNGVYSVISNNSIIKREGTTQYLEARTRAPLWKESLSHEDHANCFIAAYGASRRTESPEAYVTRRLGIRSRRVASLFEPQIGLIPLSMAYKQCQKQERWKEIVEIVNQLIPEQVRLITKADEHNEPQFQYDGITLPISQLSDGYRLFIGWLIDCLTHLAQVWPSDLKLTEAVGIVIVDEVDLFLAPSWQRTVLESLSNTFKSIQWFCSTHSALVAGSLECENVYILESAGPYTSRFRQPTDKFEGKSVETVLIELFNVQQPRSTELQRQLKEMARRAMEGDVEASIGYLRLLGQGTAPQ